MKKTITSIVIAGSLMVLPACTSAESASYEALTVVTPVLETYQLGPDVDIVRAKTAAFWYVEIQAAAIYEGNSFIIDNTRKYDVVYVETLTDHLIEGEESVKVQPGETFEFYVTDNEIEILN